MHRQWTKSKIQSQLCMFFYKLQLVCIWAPATRREVCPRLLQSMLIKKLYTKLNLSKLLPNMHNCKYPIFRSQQMLSKSHRKALQWYQHRDQLSLGYDTEVWPDGGWSEVSLCRAARIRVFPRNAVMDRKLCRAETKISSSSTPLTNSSRTVLRQFYGFRLR